MKRDTGLICGLGGTNVTECEEDEGKVEKRERRRRSKVIRWSGEAWVYGVVLTGRRVSEDLRLEEGLELNLLKGRPQGGVCLSHSRKMRGLWARLALGTGQAYTLTHLCFSLQ